MAFSESQLSALETAISQGALEVQYNDRRIRYYSLSDMIRLRDSMRAEMGLETPKTARARFINLPTGKNL